MSKSDSQEGLGGFLEGLRGSLRVRRIREDLGGSSRVLEGLGGS